MSEVGAPELPATEVGWPVSRVERVPQLPEVPKAEAAVEGGQGPVAASASLQFGGAASAAAEADHSVLRRL